ncbi:TatD family hydrolase [Thiomicrospira microaerophila]|uniref:TatD family hydrolase n=1 Tax=Thiomicrospira microaerophila TaxID=406020 RepID=UPI00069799B2|nr:TatD family hydrolase [Thiomicrospira microaerophila]
MVIDTHAHLPSMPSGLLIKHPVVSVSTDLSSSLAVIHTASLSRFIIPAVGIHPWYVSDQALSDISILFGLAKFFNVQAIGEIGLDFSTHHKSTKNLQLLIFEAQLAFAHTHSLSVSIHLVKAYNEAYLLLERYPVKGVIHGFSGSVEQARVFVDLGFYIGIGAICLRDNTPKYDRLIRDLPLASLVVETDYPNVLQPNHQTPTLSMIYAITSYISQVKHCSLELVEQITTQNAMKGFNLDEFK